MFFQTVLVPWFCCLVPYSSHKTTHHCFRMCCNLLGMGASSLPGTPGDTLQRKCFRLPHNSATQLCTRRISSAAFRQRIFRLPTCINRRFSYMYQLFLYVSVLVISCQELPPPIALLGISLFAICTPFLLTLLDIPHLRTFESFLRIYPRLNSHGLGRRSSHRSRPLLPLWSAAWI